MFSAANLSVCVALVSAGFHMWSVVSRTFSLNCSDRSLTCSKLSASRSGLRRSILIRSTGQTVQMVIKKNLQFQENDQHFKATYGYMELH